MQLTGKRAIVTGAASGVGRATALVMAERGASVFLIDVDSKEGAAASEQIAKSGGKATFAAGDVSSGADMERCFNECIRAFGRPDVLVNNAAIAIIGRVVDLTEAQWNRTLGVNLTGIFHLSRLVIPEMIKGGGGVILNVASITGLVGVKEHAAYCASKGGVIALTRAMAFDHAGDGIRVNAVCPSGIDTPQMAALFAHSEDPARAKQETIAKHPIGRMADPKELAAFLSYLASDEASYITGSIYTFDGGYTAVR